MKRQGQCLLHTENRAMQAALGVYANETFRTPLPARPCHAVAGACRIFCTRPLSDGRTAQTVCTVYINRNETKSRVTETVAGKERRPR